jgi:hypothetical protein
MKTYEEKLRDAIRYAVDFAFKECGVGLFKKTSLFLSNERKAQQQ